MCTVIVIDLRVHVLLSTQLIFTDPKLAQLVDKIKQLQRNRKSINEVQFSWCVIINVGTHVGTTSRAKSVKKKTSSPGATIPHLRVNVIGVFTIYGYGGHLGHVTLKHYLHQQKSSCLDCVSSCLPFWFT